MMEGENAGADTSGAGQPSIQESDHQAEISSDSGKSPVKIPTDGSEDVESSFSGTEKQTPQNLKRLRQSPPEQSSSRYPKRLRHPPSRYGHNVSFT